MAAIIVGGLGVVGLLLLALLLVREQMPVYRFATLGAAVFSLGISTLIVLATGQKLSNAIAIVLLGTAVLPLVLLSQLRFIRNVTTRRG